jgi:hypothetical protein
MSSRLRALIPGWHDDTLLAWRRLLFYNFKIVVGSAWWLYLLGLLGWFGILVFRTVMGWNEQPWQAHDVQNGVLSLPLVPIAIYFGMTLLYEEVDNKTIEAALTLGGDGLTAWLAKLFTAALCLGLAALGLALLAYLLLVPFPPLTVLFNAMLPVAFYGALALMLSLVLRGEIACGMLTALVLGVNLLTWDALTSARLNPFFNPLLPPGSGATYVDADAWLAMTVQNRVGVALATLSMLIYSLHRIRDRERLV